MGCLNLGHVVGVLIPLHRHAHVQLVVIPPPDTNTSLQHPHKYIPMRNKKNTVQAKSSVSDSEVFEIRIQGLKKDLKC